MDTYDLEPGDRIYVDAGTYTLNAPITWGANDSGSSSAPVQILGVPGGSNTKLVGSGTAYALVIGTGCEWVTVRSITAQSATTAGIAILGGKDISLVDCTVQNNTGSGIYAEAAVRMSCPPEAATRKKPRLTGQAAISAPATTAPCGRPSAMAAAT